VGAEILGVSFSMRRAIFDGNPVAAGSFDAVTTSASVKLVNFGAGATIRVIINQARS
jgi:hypothetical protein